VAKIREVDRGNIAGQGKISCSGIPKPTEEKSKTGDDDFALSGESGESTDSEKRPEREVGGSRHGVRRNNVY